MSTPTPFEAVSTEDENTIVAPPVEAIEDHPLATSLEESACGAHDEANPDLTVPMPASMIEPEVIAQPTELLKQAARPLSDATPLPFAPAPSAAPPEAAAPEAREIAAQPAVPEVRVSAVQPADSGQRMPAVRPVTSSDRVTETSVRAPAVRTRADDLLARFGSSCGDDASMREAAAGLRRIAGIEGTPMPDEVAVSPVPERKPIEIAAQLPFEDEMEEAPPVPKPRRRSFPSFAVALFVLFLGVAGGGALVRLRPDLFGVERLLDTPAAQPITPKAAPAITAEPRGAQAPATAIDGAHASAR